MDRDSMQLSMPMRGAEGVINAFTDPAHDVRGFLREYIYRIRSYRKPYELY